MQLFALKPLFALFMTTLKLLKGGNYVSQGRGNEVPTTVRLSARCIFAPPFRIIWNQTGSITEQI